MGILDEIVVKTKERVEKEKKLCSLEQMKELAIQRKSEDSYNSIEDNPFYHAIAKTSLSFICEVKKASPSKGIIVKEFPYVEIAKEYENAGASAISVLTEPYFFKGSNKYLVEIEKNVSIPILRKDFTVDEYQIYEAKSIGASAILLIVSILTKEQLMSFYSLATTLGLAVLMETHNAREVSLAIEVGARLIGVNNRDLQTFQVNIKTSIELRRLVPDSILFISESGIKTKEDIEELYQNQVDGVLIGETMMLAKNKKDLINTFICRTKIKLCGIRRKEDVSLCNEFLPDFVGFVFARSKRRVSFDEAKELSELLDKRIIKVGVFVDECIENIVALVNKGVIQYIQLHGSEDEAYIKSLRYNLKEFPKTVIIKAVRVREIEDISRAEESRADYLLFDAYCKECEGGNGVSFNWELLKNATRPYFLAGGIDAYNIKKALLQTRPYAIDVSSGIELNGYKDREKLSELMKRIRE